MTTPDAALTAAIPMADVVHVPPDIVEAKVVIPPTQIFCAPDNVPAIGAFVTVIVPVAVAGGQPPVVVTV